MAADLWVSRVNPHASSPDRPRLRQSILFVFFFSDWSRFVHLSDSSSRSVSVGLVHHLICDVLQFRSTSPSVKPALLFPIGIVHSRRPREASIFPVQIRRQANRPRPFPSSYHSREGFLSTLVTVCHYNIYFSVIDRWTDRCSQWLRLTHAGTVQ